MSGCKNDRGGNSDAVRIAAGKNLRREMARVDIVTQRRIEAIAGATVGMAKQQIQRRAGNDNGNRCTLPGIWMRGSMRERQRLRQHHQGSEQQRQGTTQECGAKAHQEKFRKNSGKFQENFNKSASYSRVVRGYIK